jgi:hypothetical protein
VIDKLLEGLVIGGPVWCLVGIMLWMWSQQAKKHEEHWVRMETEHRDALRSIIGEQGADRKEHITATIELTKAITRVETTLDRFVDDQGSSSRTRR